MTLVQTVQQKLGYPPLFQVNTDISTQIVPVVVPPACRFSQAAIPAILIGFYTYCQNAEDIGNVLQNPPQFDWVAALYKEAAQQVVTHICIYAQVAHPESYLQNRMVDIAIEAAREIKKQAGIKAEFKSVQQLLAKQKNDILKYLPVTIPMDVLLSDATLRLNHVAEHKPANLLRYIRGGYFKGK